MVAFAGRFNQRGFMKRYTSQERVTHTRIKRRTMRKMVQSLKHQKTYAEKKQAQELRREFTKKSNDGIAELQADLFEKATKLSKELGGVHSPSWYVDRARYGALPTSVQPERRVTTWNAMVHMEKKDIEATSEDGQGTLPHSVIDA